MTQLVSMSNLLKNQLEHLEQSEILRPNFLGVNDDLSAIGRWLDEFKLSEHTHRVYEKESLRFLYWLSVEKKMRLNDVRKQDVHDYRVFLMDPQPADFWCAPLGDRRNSRVGQWKPFSGPLKLRSIQTAMTVLNGLFQYLTDAQYLQANPFALIKQRLVERFDLEARKIDIIERMISKEEYDLLLQSLETVAIEEGRTKIWCERSSFIIKVLAYLGLRVSELVDHSWSDFICQGGKWWLVVLGKGKKLARVPVNDECLDVINHYREVIGLSSLNTISLTTDPIICKLSKKNDPLIHDGLTERAVHLLLKEVAQFAKKLTNNVQLHEKYDKFSPHWLRHFCASMQAQADIPFEFIKAHHRHSKDETTRLYMHHEDDQRHDWAQQLTLRPKNIK